MPLLTSLDALLDVDENNEPIVAGTRVRVQTIAGLWRWGFSADRIWEQWEGSLTRAQVFAALAYYLENSVALDEDLARDQEAYDLGERRDASKMPRP